MAIPNIGPGVLPQSDENRCLRAIYKVGQLFVEGYEMGIAHGLSVSELAVVFEERPRLSEAVAAFLVGDERHHLPECRTRVQDFGRAFLYAIEEGLALPVEPGCICGDR